MTKQWFYYDVKYDWSASAAPDVNTVGFGDGYEQRSPNGLNHNLRNYSLSIAGRRDDIDVVEDFFVEMGGYQSFWWHDVRQYKDILVKCSQWDVQGNGNNASISFTFQQVVN